MGIIIFLAVCFLAPLVVGDQGSPVYNVVDYGACGDGNTDDSKAILDAWSAACRDSGGSPTLLIPSGKTFFSSQLSFEGPCVSPLHIQVDGEIVAPNGMWKASDMAHWIKFSSIIGLTIDGSGQIDGRGSAWWACKQNNDYCGTIPDGLAIMNCEFVRLGGLKFIDSPGIHVSITRSNGVHVSGLTITAPGDSPNTDGVHIENCEHVEIVRSTIGTGDDCISIGTGSSDVNVSHITCGPGHGISIGSLGKDDCEARVEQINVSYCDFFNTTNGVRIKTWQGGSGFAKGILFEHIRFNSVKRPILIDQYYCVSGHNCQTKTSAVQVSDVHYMNMIGSTTSDVAISLNCSESVACTGIIMDNVEIKSAVPAKSVSSVCVNAYGEKKDPVIPSVPCLA